MMLFIVMLEMMVCVFICWGIVHEQQLIRFERALFKAVVWELYERFVERDVLNIKGGEKNG